MTALPRSPAVAVVMPVLDPDPVYFPRAVESVLRQTFTDFEFIIVEDPSPRAAGEILTRYSDPRIRHLLNPARTSFAAQINRGLAEAQAELIARFDADDICMPDRLEKQVRFLHEDQDVDVLGSHLEIINQSDECLGYRAYPLEHERIVRAMPRFNPVPHPAVMYRKEKIVAASGYHVTRYKGTEDYDLWSRLAKRGARFANYSAPLVQYRVHWQATKAVKLRDSIRGTLDVKRTYWLGSMDWRGRMRMWAEQLLVWMPRWLVLRLFVITQYRRGRPTP